MAASGLSQSQNTLRNSALHPSPDLVLLSEILGLLPGSDLLNGFVFFLGTQQHPAPMGFGLCTFATIGARLTVCATESDSDNWFASPVEGRVPVNAGLTSRAGHLLGSPINLKVGQVKAFIGLGLPTGVR